MTDFEDVVQHYGIPGMKWGVRKASSSSSDSGGSDEPSSKPKVPKGFLNRKLKKHQELSPDAEVFNALRKKAKTTGINSLTNDEIGVLTKRAELLGKYNKSFPKKKNPLASMLIEGMLSEFGEATINTFVGPRSPDMAVKVRDTLPAIREIRKQAKAAKK